MAIDVTRDREVVHEHIVEGVVMGIEDHHNKVGTNH